MDVDHYLSSKPELTHRYENIYAKVVAYERLIGDVNRKLKGRVAIVRVLGRKLINGLEVWLFA
jgi:hypothetical protein